MWGQKPTDKTEKIPVVYKDTLKFHKLLDNHQGAVESVTYSHDGQYFATGSWDRLARLYRVDSLNQYTFLRDFKFHHAAITCLEISRDAKYVAIGSKDFTFSVFELQTGKLRYVSRDHKKAISQLLFDSSSSFLISASLDGTARVYRVEDFEKTNPASMSLSYASKINGAQLSPSAGKFLLAADDGKVVEVTMKGTVTGAYIGHQARVTCLDLSHGKKLIASGSDDKTVRIWDYKTKKLVHILEGHNWFITSVHFSQDDRFLISSCNDGEVKIWDVATGKELYLVPKLGTNARQAIFSPNMKSVAVATLQNGPKYGPVLYHANFPVPEDPKKQKTPLKPGVNPNGKKGTPVTGTKKAADATLKSQSAQKPPVKAK